MPTIIVDLDGTLCDSSHRNIHAQNCEWDTFHSLLSDDKVHADVAEFLGMVSRLARTVAVTGRNERYRLETLKWLNHHRIWIDEILMRPDTDFTPDHELKPKMLEAFYGSKEKVLADVLMVLDDRDKVVESWRNYGLPCWQVRPGAF